MKYEVKNLKTFNGRDGGGFECSLYKDGKRIGTVFNGGCGAGNYYDFGKTEPKTEQRLIRELQALAVEQDPTCDGYCEAHDLYIDHLLECYENNRQAKKGILYRKSAEALYEAYLAKGITEDALRSKYPNAVIWNINTQTWA